MKGVRLFSILIASILFMSACEKLDGNKHSVVVLDGDVSFFDSEIAFNVLIEDSDPFIEGTGKHAKEYYTSKSEEEYAMFLDDLHRAHESFITYYNENKGSLLSTIDNNIESQYLLTVNVTNMYVGNGAGVVFRTSKKSGGAEISGTMKLTDTLTEEVICEFEFYKIKGMLSPKFRGRAISMYRYLADELINTVN